MAAVNVHLRPLRCFCKLISLCIAAYFTLLISFVYRESERGGSEDILSRAKAGKKILFVGGLQRSGTTTAVKLLEESLYESCSKQENQNIKLGRGRDLIKRISKERGMSPSYVKDALSSGGIEGKFVQSVYPYHYFLKEWGSGGSETIAKLSLLGHVGERNALGNRLYEEWRPFWNESANILIEKTPENILMSQFLQNVFRVEKRFSHIAFVFVLRHPLAWSLVIDKWLKNKWNREYTKPLRPVHKRIQMWLDVYTTFLYRDAPLLYNLAIFHAETADRYPQELISLVLTRIGLLISPSYSNAVKSPFSGYILANLAYLACWLNGNEWNSKRRRCDDASSQAHSRAQQRRTQFEQIRLAFENQTALLGYGFPSALPLRLSTNRHNPVSPLTDWHLADIGLWPQRIAPQFRAFFAVVAAAE